MLVAAGRVPPRDADHRDHAWPAQPAGRGRRGGGGHAGAGDGCLRPRRRGPRRPVQGHPGAGLGPARSLAQPSADLAQRLPDGSVFVPKPTQRLLVLRTTMTEAGDVPPDGRVAGPGHPRPERQRRGAVLGGRAPVAGRLPACFPRLGTKVRKGDVLADRNPAGPGRRRLGHAPAPGRARPADRRRRASGRALPQARHHGRRRPDPARRRPIRAEGPAGPPDRPRQGPSAAGGPGGTRSTA